jgi:hypothetical protein
MVGIGAGAILIVALIPLGNQVVLQAQERSHNQEAQAPTSTNTPTPTTPPTSTPTGTPTLTPIPTGTPDSTPWTYMLYFAGDNDLHPYLERAIDKMERVANKPNLNILVLWDGWSDGDTRLYHIQYDTASGIASPVISVVWNDGELGMDAPKTLQDFVNWSRTNYPADHYLLSIADHGRGTSGIAWDDTSGGDRLSAYAELEMALDAIADGGNNKIDVLFFDASLMGLIEVAYEVKGDVDYIVASENLGWSVFAYDRYISHLADDTTPRQLAENIADAYFAALYGNPGTISVLDMSFLDSLGSAVDALAQALSAYITPTNFSQVIDVRDGVQILDSRNYQVLDSADEYIDLYHLAQMAKMSIDDVQVQSAAQGVMDAVEAAVIAEHHRSGTDPWSKNYWDLDHAHGISIYFPPRSGGWDYLNYVTGGSWTFCAETAWDEFLVDYFWMPPPPPLTPGDPGIPPMLPIKAFVFLPLVMSN